jgi:hypothetical protein
MSRYAVITAENIVDSVVEWDGNEQTWQPPEGMTTWPDDGAQANPGFIFDPVAHTFTPPAEQPEPLDPDQAPAAESSAESIGEGSAESPAPADPRDF